MSSSLPRQGRNLQVDVAEVKYMRKVSSISTSTVSPGQHPFLTMKQLNWVATLASKSRQVMHKAVGFKSKPNKKSQRECREIPHGQIHVLASFAMHLLSPTDDISLLRLLLEGKWLQAESISHTYYLIFAKSFLHTWIDGLATARLSLEGTGCQLPGCTRKDMVLFDEKAGFDVDIRVERQNITVALDQLAREGRLGNVQLEKLIELSADMRSDKKWVRFVHSGCNPITSVDPEKVREIISHITTASANDNNPFIDKYPR
jgi:hypothetical protein